MTRLTLALITTLLVSTLSTPAHAVDIGWSMSECRSTGTSDGDVDGLHDDCEATLASTFEPVLVFYDLESTSARVPFWAVRRVDADTIQVFYALSYLEDAGDPQLGNVSAHDGDPEVIIVEASNGFGRDWQIDRVFLSAHYLAGWTVDRSRWYAHGELSYYQNPRVTPIVHVAEQKHANYVSASACDAAGAFNFDRCDQISFAQWLGVYGNRNLGHPDFPLWTGVLYDGDSDGTQEQEEYWTSLRFCGWQVDGTANSGRGSCAFADNAYGSEFGDFGFTTCNGPSNVRYLSAGGQQVEPGGNYYYASASGRHAASLRSPGFADFDLYLFHWTGSWNVVAASTSVARDTVIHDGPAGYYAWVVHARVGSGAYTICTVQP